jgi:hypothetical protein
MPLLQGESQAVINANIKKLVEEGYTREQASAIAYNEAKKSKNKRLNKLYASRS